MPRLTKTSQTTWRHGDFTIERREYVLPSVHHVYRVTRHGKTLDDCETLREVREVITMTQDDERARHTCARCGYVGVHNPACPAQATKSSV